MFENRDHDDEERGTVGQESEFRVPEGFYCARYLRKAPPYKYRGDWKQTLWFELLEGPMLVDEYGECIGEHDRHRHYDDSVTLPMYCSVKVGSERRIGSSPKSKLVRLYRLATGQLPTRLDRVDADVAKGKCFIVKVADVETDYDRDVLDQSLRYSVVRKVRSLLIE